MKIKNGSQGFTLLELLIVVLIIGILAAIALPQYRKAVGKAELAQVTSATKAIQNAQERYYLIHGKYTSNINNLDINLPNGNVICSIYVPFSICRNKNYVIAHYYSQRVEDNQIECYAKNAKMISACEQFLNKKGTRTTDPCCNYLDVNSCYSVITKLSM